MIQRFMVSLFTLIWWNRLWINKGAGVAYRRHVDIVKSPRTAILENGRFGRETVTFCLFKGE